MSTRTETPGGNTSAEPVSAAAPGARSRRAVLAGALGGAAAWALASVDRPALVSAASDGDAFILGSSANQTNQTTFIQSTVKDLTVFKGFGGNSDGGGVVIEGEASAVHGVGVHGVSSQYRGVVGTSTSGRGVHGESTSGWGVYGRSDEAHGMHGVGAVGVYGESSSAFGTAGRGVYGIATSGVGIGGVSRGAGGAGAYGHSQADGTGMIGYSGPAGSNLPAPRAKTGVYAVATQDADSRGVVGQTTAGQGIRGEASSGVGLYGTASSGYALRTSGRVRVDKVSGVATIAAGRTSVTVSPGVDVTSSAFVLLTPRTNIAGRALWFSTSATANTITIRMSTKRSSSTSVAWLLLG